MRLPAALLVALAALPAGGACVPDPSGCPMVVAEGDGGCACPGIPTPPTCAERDGIFLEWRRDEVSTWDEAARLPCTPRFVDDCGAISPRWCPGLDRAVPLVRWLPSLPAGTAVSVRIVPYHVYPGTPGSDVRPCQPAAQLALCWPLVREYGPTSDRTAAPAIADPGGSYAAVPAGFVSTP